MHRSQETIGRDGSRHCYKCLVGLQVNMSTDSTETGLKIAKVNAVIQLMLIIL